MRGLSIFFMFFIGLMFLLLFSSCNLFLGTVDYLNSMFENPSEKEVPGDNEGGYDPSGAHLSRAPLGSTHWLQVAGSSSEGDPDQVGVYFFVVPDHLDFEIFFAINDPSVDSNKPDDDFNVIGWTSVFSLIGGSGCYSDFYSRKQFYSLADKTAKSHLTGNLLQEASFGLGSDSGWWYFNAVNPSSGEHIGSNYYFKVVVVGSGDVSAKNAFQLDVSIEENASEATGITGVRAFAYSWCLAFNQDSANPWYFYPLIEDRGASDLILYNWDYDGYGITRIYTPDNMNTYSLIASGDCPFTYPSGASYKNYSIGGYVDKYWKYEIDEEMGGPMVNTGELWIIDSVTSEAFPIFNYPI